MKAATVPYVDSVSVPSCLSMWGQCICECDNGRQRGEELKEVNDSHALELGHVNPASCVRIS